jgi:hypothetical protein
VTDERRQFQRLLLAEPVDGWFGDWPVRLVDVSAAGALLEPNEPLPAGARALLRFFWRGREVEVTAETVRANALTFVEDAPILRELIALSATELLRAQEANALGMRDANVIGEHTLTTASGSVRISGYVTWTLDNGGWKVRPSLLPDQPANGFTVSVREAEDQIALLCRTYETGDGEARRLTRMLAELSVANPDESGD